MIANYMSKLLFEYSKYEIGYKLILYRVLFNIFINGNLFWNGYTLFNLSHKYVCKN